MKIIINGRYTFNITDREFVIPNAFRKFKELEIEIVNYEFDTLQTFNGLINITKFNRKYKFKHIDIKNEYKIDAILPPYDMSNMFENSTTNIPDITHFDTSEVTNLSSTFQNSTFNQDISKWNVSNVTKLENIFKDNKSFNHNLSNWKIPAIPYKPDSFDQNTSEDWNMSDKPWTNNGTFFYNIKMFGKVKSIMPNLVEYNAIGMSSFISESLTSARPARYEYNGNINRTDDPVRINNLSNSLIVPMSFCMVEGGDKKPRNIFLTISYQDVYSMQKLTAKTNYKIILQYDEKEFIFDAKAQRCNIVVGNNIISESWRFVAIDYTNEQFMDMYDYLKSKSFFGFYIKYWIYPILE